jgi:hypothetical protein
MITLDDLLAAFEAAVRAEQSADAARDVGRDYYFESAPQDVVDAAAEVKRARDALVERAQKAEAALRALTQPPRPELGKGCNAGAVLRALSQLTMATGDYECDRVGAIVHEAKCEYDELRRQLREILEGVIP